MDQVGTLAGALSGYGLYTVIAVLIMAVVYLWRQVEKLNLRINELLAEQNKLGLELNTRLGVALEANTKMLEKVEKRLEE